MSSIEEAEAEGSEVDSSITQAEVTEVVQEAPRWQGTAGGGWDPPWVPQMSGCGGAVLVDTTLHHCVAVGDSASGLADRGVVPLYKKGNRRVCSNYRGKSYSSSASRESLCQGTGEENSPIRKNRAVFIPVVEHWTSSIPFPGCMGVCPTNPRVLWIWRRHSTVSLLSSCGGCSGSMGTGPVAKGCPVPVRPEQELGSHCRQ